MNSMVGEVVVALLDDRLGFADQRGTLSVVEEDTLENWLEVLG